MRMRRPVLIALLVAAPLCGCAAVGPDYQKPAAIVPAQYKEMKGWKLGSPRDAALYRRCGGLR